MNCSFSNFAHPLCAVTWQTLPKRCAKESLLHAPLENFARCFCASLLALFATTQCKLSLMRTGRISIHFRVWKFFFLSLFLIWFCVDLSFDTLQRDSNQCNSSGPNQFEFTVGRWTAFSKDPYKNLHLLKKRPGKNLAHTSQLGWKTSSFVENEPDKFRGFENEKTRVRVS